MSQFRIFEIRKDVYGIEEQKRIWFFPFIKIWEPLECCLMPSVPEYSPVVPCEFTLEAAKRYIADQAPSVYITETQVIKNRMTEIIDKNDSGEIDQKETMKQLRRLINDIRR